MEWLSPGRWLLILALAFSLMVGLPLLKHRYDKGQQAIGYDQRAAEDKAAAEAQTARNRELGRLAEMKFHTLAQRQTVFLTKAAKGVHDAAAPLATCPVPADLRLRLKAARACALGDSAAACGADDGMPAAR